MKYSGFTLSMVIFCMLTGLVSNAQRLIFKTYTVEDGLVSNPVRRIYQDKKGFIWIATWEGLSKYDGNKFTNYTIANGLSHNMVNDMYESADGKLYIAENNGGVDILRQDAIIKKAAFPDVVINQFYITQNHRVMAATDTNGLQEIKNEVLVKPPQVFPRSTYNDLTNLNDSLLIGGSEGSLRILNNSYELFSEIKQPKQLLTFKIYKDSKNRIWVGTNKGLKLVSVLQINNQLLSFIPLPAPFNIPALRDHVVSDILEDDNGNFWIATSHGLVKIDPKGNSQVLSEKDGLPSVNISCIYQDREKNIWIGTLLGLSKLVTQNNIRIYTVENGLASNGVNFLLPVKNDIFLAITETGVQLYNTTSRLFSSVTSQHNFFYHGIVQNSRPVLFYSGNNRLGRYDSANRRIVDNILQGPSNAEVYCSVIDANGIIFNGTQIGLLIRSGENSWYDNKFPYRITALLIDQKGYLWAGTWDKGLYRIHYTTTNNKSGSDQVRLSIEDLSELLPDKSIRCLFEDSNGNIWIGTRYHGIMQLSNNKGQYAAQYFDLPHGLTSSRIRAIAEDTKGCIWIGSDLGIDKLIPKGKVFRVFNFSRVNNYFADINAILPGSDHSLWFATNNGLVNIIDGETEQTPAPPVYITAVNLSDTGFNYKKHVAGMKVQLKYYQNQAAFEFSSPGFINEKQIYYSYRLLGSADTMWSHPANLHNVSYASLQPGNYRFDVRTIGWNGEWGAPANFEFIIRPPYWQTWWFYLLVGVFMVLLFYAFYFYRIRQLLKLQNVRNRISSDLHDDIGARLTNIQILSALSEQKLDEPVQAGLYLRRIVNEVQTSGEALDDIVWSINAKNDQVEDIAARMRRYVADVFEGDQLQCTMNVNDNISGIKLIMEKRRDLYLVFKESLNNIRKHSKASMVNIELLVLDNKVLMNIEDNGIGFDVNLPGNRNGLTNMKRRMEKWKGNAIIESTAGKGTRLHVKLPINSPSLKQTILNWLSFR